MRDLEISSLFLALNKVAHTVKLLFHMTVADMFDELDFYNFSDLIL
jgi:hypothetical protein